MLLPFAIVLAQAAPRDLTAKDAQAATYLFRARQIAAHNRLGRLDRHLLPKGDAEVRLWSGFSWTTDGLVLKRRGGRWTALRMGDAPNTGPFRINPPRDGWPAFWAQAGRLGLWTLPDQNEVRDPRGPNDISDGTSTLVELQRDGAYRAYGYNNPAAQTAWPPARPMAALDRYVRRQFTR